MFEFKTGEEIAQLSVSELTEYRDEVQSAYSQRKDDGTADFAFLTKVRDALTAVKTAMTQMAVQEVEDVIADTDVVTETEDAAEEAPEPEAEFAVADDEDDADDAEDAADASDADEDGEDDEEEAPADEAEAEAPQYKDADTAGREAAEAVNSTLSLDEIVAAINATLDSRLAAITVNERKDNEVGTVDLSNLGHDNAASTGDEGEPRNKVTLASTGEFDREQLRKDLMNAVRNSDKGTAGEMIKLGTITDFRKPDVELVEGAAADNHQKILETSANYLRMSNDEVLTASLCCAPLDPIRELRTWCDSSTGLFTLPKMGAPYGGVNYAIPSNACGLNVPTFTWLEECEPGAAAQSDKTCGVIECGTFEEVRVNAFGYCFEWSNGQAKFNPEQLEYYLSEARCRFEHVDSQRLFNLVLTHPRVATQVGTPDTIAAAGGSAFGDLAEIISIKFEEMRRDLAAPNLTPNIVAPVWINDLLYVDNLRRGGNVTSGPGFTQLVQSLGGTVQYLQHWQAPATGAGVAGWPSDVEFLLHAPGVFREVDGGSLDFGIMRDSELNKQNKVRMAWEKWNAVAFVGPDCSANYIEVTGLCAGGAVGPRIDVCA